MGATSSSQNLLLHITGTWTINSITVPASQGGISEYAAGSLAGSGCSVGSPIAGGSGLDCVLPVTFSPVFPGARRIPLVISAHIGSTAVTFTEGLTGVGLGAQIGFTPAVITTVAGTGTLGYTGDGGLATAAKFQQPFAVAVDFQGNLFISDFSKDVVRRVDALTQVVTTVTGTGTPGYSGDLGPAASGTLHSPSGLSFDAAASLYIADSGNQAIRKIDSASGQISTFAGTGSAGYSGDGADANSATMHIPNDVGFDGAGSLYISDFGNDALRRIDADSLVITTAAGNGSPGSTGDGGLAVDALLDGPAAVAVNTVGDVYIADDTNNVIRKIAADGRSISVVAGTGTAGFSGDGGVATSAKFSNPQGLAVDAAGNLYIADSDNNVFRKLSASTQNVSTLAGNATANTAGYSGDTHAATSALLHTPTHPALDAAGNIYFADSANGVVRKIAGIAPVAFASTAINASSAALDVTIANNGNAALVISGLTLPADYNVSGGHTTCTGSTTLAPAASCVLGIVFAPTATGALNETLTVTDSLGTQNISLTGTGTAAAPPPPSLTVTTTTLTVPSASVTSGEAVTLTATVSPAPTGSSRGTVSFLDGTTLLGTANVNSAGVATFTAQGLADGDHHITAVYSGSSTSAVSTSAAVTITITAATPPTTPQFNVTAPTTPVAATPGTPVAITIGVPPIGTFNSKVTMSASGLPAGATATFNPPVVTPGSAGATTVMTVTFAMAAGSAPLSTPSQPTPSMPFAPFAPFALFGVSVLGLIAMRTQKFAALIPRPLTAAFATAALLVASVTVVGCNGGFAGPPANTVAPQTVVVTVTGTSGSIKHSTTVTIHLQ